MARARWWCAALALVQHCSVDASLPSRGISSSVVGGAAASFNAQILTAYYSGVGLDTIGTSGLNSISIAFFSPAAMASSACNFSDIATPCIQPAAGGGNYDMQYLHDTITTALPLLAPSSLPFLPLIFISFGGANCGGAPWDAIGGDAATATAFGANAAALVHTLAAAFPGGAFGVDLDIEGTSTSLPHTPALIAAYRAAAPYPAFPLQLCALSGLALASSTDHWKVALLAAAGPAQGGLSHVNLMVDNVIEPCAVYAPWWNATELAFLPPYSRNGGCWGIIFPTFILHGPGCTDGPTPLFPWMQYATGLAVWEWWVGDATPLIAVISAVRRAPSAPW